MTEEPLPDFSVQRSSGTTESEKHLARLAEQTFLNLWSYPNLCIDKRLEERESSKFVC